MRVHASAKTITMIAAVLTLVLSTTTGCCPLLESVSTQMPAEPVEEQVAETTVDPTLDEWARADTRTGTFELTTTFADGRVLVQTGEFWLAGDLIRYDLYEDGELIRSIQTPDGVNAYFVQHADQICEPSVADASYYLRNFSVPSKAAVEDGIDEETGAIRMKYVVQETYAVAGSSNGWYTEDTTYLLTDGQVTGIVTRGCVPEDDGSIGDLQVSRRILTSVEVGGEVPEGTFDLPYPIQEAN
ncbi:MAG: hypothetical protein JXR33_08305 [Coriobacteriia bacterium]|nr:hypothetical protein [Coriobacteriia bacterium]